MHPQILKKEPGDCPICGMKLVPVATETRLTESLSAAATARRIQYYRSTMMPGEVSDKPGKDSMGMDMEPVYEDGEVSATIRIDAATTQRMNLKIAAVTRGPVQRMVRSLGTVTYDEHGLRDMALVHDSVI